MHSTRMSTLHASSRGAVHKHTLCFLKRANDASCCIRGRGSARHHVGKCMTARLRRRVILQAAVSPFFYKAEEENYVLDASGWTWSDGDVPYGPEGFLSLEPGARIGYFRSFFKNAGSLFCALEKELPWIRGKVIIDGKSWQQPRSICYMADAPWMTYTYYKTTNHPVPYTPTVLQIKSQLDEFLGTHFNCVLNNLYENGGEFMEWHPDDEPLFGPDPVIGSVSFGQRRPFDFRNATQPEIRFRYMLGEGDLLVMEGGVLQQHWEHALLVSDQKDKGRINMTFRTITDPEPT